MGDDLDDLEAKARAATPGPWYANKASPGRFEVCVPPLPHGHTNAPGWIAEASQKNVRHIAACSPDVILPMIEELRQLQSDAMFHRMSMAQLRRALGWPDPHLNPNGTVDLFGGLWQPPKEIQEAVEGLERLQAAEAVCKLAEHIRLQGCASPESPCFIGIGAKANEPRCEACTMHYRFSRAVAAWKTTRK